MSVTVKKYLDQNLFEGTYEDIRRWNSVSRPLRTGVHVPANPLLIQGEVRGTLPESTLQTKLEYDLAAAGVGSGAGRTDPTNIVGVVRGVPPSADRGRKQVLQDRASARRSRNLLARRRRRRKADLAGEIDPRKKKKARQADAAKPPTPKLERTPRRKKMNTDETTAAKPAPPPPPPPPPGERSARPPVEETKKKSKKKKLVRPPRSALAAAEGQLDHGSVAAATAATGAAVVQRGKAF